jgi:hypothetical protein
MAIDSWILLWKVTLIASVGLFAALTLVVTFGGARDIVRLVRNLREQHRKVHDER